MLTLEGLITKFQSIKTFPHVAVKLTKMISANEGSSSEYEKIIKHDPALVMRVFKLVNSSFFSLREKVETISDAVARVGLDNLRNMVVVQALKDLYKEGLDNENFSREKLWMHCVATGVCAQMISERVFAKKGEDAFLCGLLHDVGLIIESQLEPELFAAMLITNEKGTSFVKNEEKNIGINHCEAGFWLSRDWKLPASVQFGIRDHHFMSDETGPSTITGIIQLAELLTSRLGYSAVPEVHDNIPKSFHSHMRENIAVYKSIASDMPEEMKKAKDIYAS